MRSLELFSGAGGLAKGLESAGFKHSAFVELNKHACDSLRKNFSPDKVFHGDIRDFDLQSVLGVDVVAGGPPCQPFSLGGKHQSNLDDRDMFPYAIKAIETLKPKAFVFENVKGLLRPTFSNYFDYILARLANPEQELQPNEDWTQHLERLQKIEPNQNGGLQYDIHWKLLNAADYGIPQTRERVVIVGLRSDLKLKWQFPRATHSEDRLLWDMFVTKRYWERHQVFEHPIFEDDSFSQKMGAIKTKYEFFEPDALPWQTVRDALCDVPDPRESHDIQDHAYKAGARTYPGHTGSDFDWPSKTIKAGGHGVPGGENMIRYPNGDVRYLTVFEAKRIQTFPDEFEISGAWGEAMRQIGNAVPVTLGAVIGKQLAYSLNPQQRETQ